MPDPLAGWQKLGPGELVAGGYVNPGPLAPAIQSKDPAQNAQAIREQINPDQLAAPPRSPLQNVERIIPSGIVGPSLGAIGGGALGAFAGGAGAVPGAILGAGAGGGLEAAIRQKIRGTVPSGSPDEPTVLGGVLGGVAQQSVAEGGGGAFRFLKGQRDLRKAYQAEQATIEAAKAAKRAFPAQKAAEEAAYRGSKAASKSAFNAAQDAQEKAFQQKSAQYAEQKAAEIAKVADQQVPAWQGMGNTAKDVRERVLGTGWDKLQAMYDASLKDVITLGRGTKVKIPAGAAKELGVEAGNRVGAKVGSKAFDLVEVDAGELAMRMTGKSGTARSAYRTAARAIDEAGIGDPAARAQYRNGWALREFASRSGMLKSGDLDPKKVQTALGTEVGRKVLGRGNEALYDVLRGTEPLPAPSPLKPPPDIPRPSLSAPVVPPETITRGPAGTMSLPGVAGGVAGGTLGGYAGHLLGHPYMGYFAGHGLGQGLGSRIPIYSGPPMPPVGPLGRTGRVATGAAIRSTWDYIMGDDDSAK